MENMEREFIGSVEELSPKEELFDEYERLQIELISEEETEKRDEIEARLNTLAEKLGITEESAE